MSKDLQDESSRPDDLIRVALSRDEAIVLYHWLAGRFANDEITTPTQGVVGELCADLWDQLFGISPLEDEAYEAHLRQAIGKLKSGD